MFDNYDDMVPFAMMGFEEDFCEENLTEEEPTEEELLAEEADFLVSQQQGNWLDGYLDALDEWEE